MADLTAITTPFGLLDRETQEALNAHSGPLEWVSCNGGWIKWTNLPGNICPVNHGHLTIRVRPAPPKPREWWIVRQADGAVCAFSSFDDANSVASHSLFPIIHVVEKLPE